MNNRDAWVVARLLSDQPVNGELATVSDQYRAIAVNVDKAGAENRTALWDAFLIGQSNRSVIETAIDNARPDDPAPTLSNDASADEWEPLRIVDQPTVAPFPVDVLPESAARLVQEGAQSIGCPPDYLGLAVIAIAGGAIGRSVSLCLKPDYFASSAIWSAIVAPPSRGKSPALSAAAKAIRRIDANLADEHKHAMTTWEESPKEERGKPPKPRRIVVDDTTVESLMRVLSANPRGLVSVRDELSAFISGMDQYKSGGKGSDKSIYLKIWSGENILVDRVLNENDIPIRIPHPCVSIIGGLTPTNLGSLVGSKSGDGFIDRWLVSYPDPLPVPQWSDHGVSDKATADWAETLARIWQRPMNVIEGKDCPRVATFTSKAKKHWTDRINAHADEMNDDGFDPGMESAWGKLGEYAGRLSLVLACLRHADDPTVDPIAVPIVDESIIHDAWRLVDYFKSQARRVHATITRESDIGGSLAVRAIVEWVRTGGRPMFTVHEVKQARRWITPDDLDKALLYMANRNAVRPDESTADKPKGGRPSTPVFHVNPALLVTRNPQNT